MPGGARPENGNWVIPNELGNEMGNHCHVQSIDCKGSGNNIGGISHGTRTDPVTDPVQSLLALLQRGELSSSQLREALGIKHRPTFRRNYLHPALKAGLIEYTIPDKPNSRLQKYRLTNKGKSLITKLKQEAGADEE